MRQLIVLAIRFYQKLPDRHKRRCIFRDTCSRHVQRVTETHGVAAGLRAYQARMRVCRPVASLELDEEGTPSVALLADGSLVPVAELVPESYEAYRLAILRHINH